MGDPYIDTTNPLPFGYIHYVISTDTYTAYNNPTGFGKTYCSEVNSTTTYDRTYYSFDTSGIQDDAINFTATLTVYVAQVLSPALPPGGSITYALNAKVSWDTIGAAISIDDWGDGIYNNTTTFGSSPPAVGNTNLTINPLHINKRGDTDIELVDACSMVGIPSGNPVTWTFNTKNKAGTLYYTQLNVTYYEYYPAKRKFQRVRRTFYPNVRR